MKKKVALGMAAFLMPSLILAASQNVQTPGFNTDKNGYGFGLMSTGQDQTTAQNTPVIVVTPVPNGGDNAAMLNAAFTSGGSVEVMPGVYPILSEINCKNTAVFAINPVGSGSVVSIVAGGGFSGSALLLMGEHCRMDGLAFDASPDGGTASFDAIDADASGPPGQMHLEHATVSHGFYNFSCVNDPNNPHDLELVHNWFIGSSSDNIHFGGCGNSRIKDNVVTGAGGAAMTASGMELTITGNFFEQSNGDGLYVSGKFDSIVGNGFNNNVGANVHFDGASVIAFEGNHLNRAGTGGPGNEGVCHAGASHVRFSGVNKDLSLNGNVYLAVATQNACGGNFPDYVYTADTGARLSYVNLYEVPTPQNVAVYANAATQSVLTDTGLHNGVH